MKADTNIDTISRGGNIVILGCHSSCEIVHFHSEMSSSESSSIVLAIVGSRDWTNWDQFQTILKDYIKQHGTPIKIVTGDARGVDSMACRWAIKRGISYTVWVANWKQYGRRAGILRNTDIIKTATHVLAFHRNNSPGTRDSIEKARDMDKDLTVVEL